MTDSRNNPKLAQYARMAAIAMVVLVIFATLIHHSTVFYNR